MSSLEYKSLEPGVMGCGARILVQTAAAVFSIVLTVSLASADPLYAVYGPRGSVTFTTRKPAAGKRYRVVTGKKYSRYSSVISHRRGRLRPVSSDYDHLIEQMAKKHNLEPALVKAVVQVESGFNPRAKSPKGAMGLMQLMPGTAKRYGVRDVYHPEQNVAGGVKYLSMLLKRYNGNIRLTLAAYNAGEKVVDRLQAVPPYRETTNYVRQVTRLFNIYRTQYVTN